MAVRPCRLLFVGPAFLEEQERMNSLGFQMMSFGVT